MLVAAGALRQALAQRASGVRAAGAQLPLASLLPLQRAHIGTTTSWRHEDALGEWRRALSSRLQPSTEPPTSPMDILCQLAETPAHSRNSAVLSTLVKLSTFAAKPGAQSPHRWEGEEVKGLAAATHSLAPTSFESLTLDELVRATQALARISGTVAISPNATRALFTALSKRVTASLSHASLNPPTATETETSVLNSQTGRANAFTPIAGAENDASQKQEEKSQSEDVEVPESPAQSRVPNLQTESLTQEHVVALYSSLERLRCQKTQLWCGTALWGALFVPKLDKSAVKKLIEKVAKADPSGLRSRAFRALEAAIAKYDATYLHGSELASVFTLYGAAQEKNKAFLNTIIDRIIADLPNTKVHTLCGFIHALGSLRVVPSDHLNKLGAIFESISNRLPGLDLDRGLIIRELLWGMGRLRLRDDRILAMADKALISVLDTHQKDPYQYSVVSSSLWAFSTLSYKPSKEFVDQMYTSVRRSLQFYPALPVVAIAWALTTLNAIDERARTILRVIPANLPKERKGLMQVLQIASALNDPAFAEEKEIMLKFALAKLGDQGTGTALMKHQAAMSRMSAFQMEVSAHLANLVSQHDASLQLKHEYSIPTTQYVLDNALLGLGTCKIAVESEGPWHYVDVIGLNASTTNLDEDTLGMLGGDGASAVSRLPIGSLHLKRRFLINDGWKIVHVPFWIWEALPSSTAKQEYLMSRINPLLSIGDQLSAQPLPESQENQFHPIAQLVRMPSI